MGGHVIWITGLPGSGKTTLAQELQKRCGSRSQVLDGDWMRHTLWPELDFTPEGRMRNCMRTAHVAKLLKDQGTIVMVALVSPMRAMRLAASSIVGGMTEVNLHAPKAVLRERRPGLKPLTHEPIPDHTMMFDTSDWSTAFIADEVVGRVSKTVGEWRMGE